jgi:hypothetical protein
LGCSQNDHHLKWFSQFGYIIDMKEKKQDPLIFLVGFSFSNSSCRFAIEDL